MFVFETKWGCSNVRQRTKPKGNGTRDFFTNFTHTQECRAGGQASQLLKLFSWLSTRRHRCCGIGRWLISSVCVCVCVCVYVCVCVVYSRELQWPQYSDLILSTGHRITSSPFFHAIKASYIAREFCYCFQNRDIWLGAVKVTTAT